MSVEIFEEEHRDIEKPVILIGLPEVGLVGTISANQIVEEMKMKQVGYVESELIPPLTVLHKKRLIGPVRLYADSSHLLLLSDVPIMPGLIYPLSREITRWLEEKSPGMVVLMGGTAIQNREEVEKPKIIGIPSGKEGEKLLTDKGIEVLEEGFIVGIYGLILKECMRKNIPALYLMTEAHYGIPDPGAAAVTIEAVNKLLGLDIDTKKLLEKDEEIRLMSRDLMKSTQESMKELEKAKEQEPPVMYG